MEDEQLKRDMLHELFFFFGLGAKLLRQKTAGLINKPLRYRKRFTVAWNKRHINFPERRRESVKREIEVSNEFL